MTQTVGDLMTPDPQMLGVGATVQDAARAMREYAIGDVIVCDDSGTCGIVTDRDIVVRVVAEGRDPVAVAVGDICSRDLTTVSPDTPIDAAVALMRDNALRRLPVVDGEQLVGVVSLGDLAEDRDPSSVLADISQAPANI